MARSIETIRKNYAYVDRWKKEHPERVKQYKINAAIKTLETAGYTVVAPDSMVNDTVKKDGA